MAQYNPLRPITQRLNSTPVEELPRHAGLFAASIANCSEYFQSANVDKSDVSVQVHKLNTRVTALLQDKCQEGRFTGVVLVKALIENATNLSLASSGSVWVRNMLSCLNKQDPPQVKKLYILTITRIFMLTRGNQTLTREITTPSLPAFLTACLAVIKPSTVSKDGVDKQMLSPLLQPVYQSWLQLIKAFPATFRPFVPSVRAITLSLLSSDVAPRDVKDIAAQTFSTLHFCAPKDTCASDWAQSVQLTIESCHQVADLNFRSIVEEWSGLSPRQIAALPSKKAAREVQTTDSDAIGMEKWVGVRAGCSRAVELVRLLTVLLTCQHAQAVRLPLASILDLTARFASVLPPTKSYSLRESKEIGRDEREELFDNIARIHHVIIEMFAHLASRFDCVLMPISRPLLSQIWDIFDAELLNKQTRISTYTAMNVLLEKGAVSLQNEDSDHISNLIRRCCNDIRDLRGNQSNPIVGNGEVRNGSLTLDSAQKPKQNNDASQLVSRLSNAAWNLLPVILIYVPASLITTSIRTEIDRTAILVGHKEALLASVMNPSSSRKGNRMAPTLLPFAAKACYDNFALEAMMRPRQPILQDTSQSNMAGENDEENDVLSEPREISPDVDLQMVSDHIVEQLKNSSPVTEAIDTSVPKKRDHTETESAAAALNVEPSKRMKTEPSSVTETAVLDTTTLVHGSVGMEDIEVHTMDTIKVPEASYAMQDVVPTQTGNFSPRSDSVSRPDLLQQLAVGEDEDSDDSEIPQIDTALTSDEDEDEDEDGD